MREVSGSISGHKTYITIASSTSLVSLMMTFSLRRGKALKAASTRTMTKRKMSRRYFGMIALALAVTGCGGKESPTASTSAPESTPVAAHDPIVPVGVEDFLDYLLPDGELGPDALYVLQLELGSGFIAGSAKFVKTAKAGWPCGCAWTLLRWDEENIYLVEERAEVAFTMSNAVVFKRRWTPYDGPENGAWASKDNYITWLDLTTLRPTSTGRQPIYTKLIGIVNGVATVEHQYGKSEIERMTFTKKDGGVTWERFPTGW